MNSTASVAISLYSVALILFIICEIDKQKLKQSITQRLLKDILFVTAFMFAMDFISRFDHSAGAAYIIVYCANLLLFLLCPVVPILWFIYVHYQIFHNLTITKKWRRPLLFLRNICFCYFSCFFFGRAVLL